jgi:hypothetical protein
MTGKLRETRHHPILFSFRMSKGHEKRGGKGSHTILVATQSRFHRDMPELTLKPHKFHLGAGLQVGILTQEPNCCVETTA